MTERQLVTRRALFTALASTYAASACVHRYAPLQREFAASLAALHSRIGGRIGVYMLDTQSQLELAFNARERFAMCSTFKLLLAATGGPSGLTLFLRGIGDRVTRLDRTELELNSNLPGDPRDTTTPQAMAHSMEQVLLGDVLSTQSKLQLIAWLRQSTTGLARLRAGLPEEWKAGDKTGTGANGANNDVMIAWPPGRSAVIGAVYFSESKQPTRALERAHAEIGGFVATAVARQ
jgi:beta-lactamase class A